MQHEMQHENQLKMIQYSTPEQMPRGIIMPLEELESINSLSDHSGIAILSAAGLVVILPRPVISVQRADTVLGFLVSVSSHNI